MNSLNQDQHQDILDRTFRFAVRITRLCVFLHSRVGTGRVLSSQIVRADAGLLAFLPVLLAVADGSWRPGRRPVANDDGKEAAAPAGARSSSREELVASYRN